MALDRADAGTALREAVDGDLLFYTRAPVENAVRAWQDARTADWDALTAVERGSAHEVGAGQWHGNAGPLAALALLEYLEAAQQRTGAPSGAFDGSRERDEPDPVETCGRSCPCCSADRLGHRLPLRECATGLADRCVQAVISPLLGDRMSERGASLATNGGGSVSESLGPEQAADEFAGALKRLNVDDGDFPHLKTSIELSARRILDARKQLASVLDVEKPPIDVVAFGSMARFEMTQESDFDYLVIAYGLDVKPGAYRRSLAITDGLRTSLGDEPDALNASIIREPGASGLFGTVVSAPDLIEVIGLERDTNHSHSRRVLLLEESVSLYDQQQHERLIEAIIGRYLEARPPSVSGMPRFLLNDLARYWRTLSVDYQAKTPPPARYSIRYLKLLISRKFTYASSIAPLVAAVIPGYDDLAAGLRRAYARPPMLRMLDLAHTLSDQGDEAAVAGVVDALRVVDQFNSLLGRASWRAQIKTDCESPDPRAQATFAEARVLASRLQDALEAVFFSESIAPIARKYLTF